MREPAVKCKGYLFRSREPLVTERNPDSVVQKGEFAEAHGQYIKIIGSCFGKNRRVGSPPDGSTAFLSFSPFGNRAERLAERKFLHILETVPAHNRFHAGRQRIDDGNTDTVQTAGNLV